MGSSKRLKEKFLQAHPICCFCGGERPAEEPDHIPSRAMFLNRQWPEGFEFPACVECNRETRYDEEIVAFLSRVYPDSTGEQQTKEFTKLCASINKYRPDIIEEMNASATEKKRAAKKYNIQLKEGQTTKDLPFVSIGPLVNDAMSNFSRKLVLALYYKHAGEILPPGAGIAIRWFSNIEIANDALPQELQQYLAGYPDITRCNTDLREQFHYGFTFSECRRLSIFLAFFRNSMAILGAVNLDSQKFDLPEMTKILGPYVRE